MINKSFIDAYDKLTINNKRNELCNELIVIAEYIKYIESCLNYHGKNIQIKNYNVIKDKNKDESQILTEFYENVYLIERELELILYVLQQK